MAKKVIDALKKKFGKAITDIASEHGDEIAYITRDKLVEIATWLRDDPKMAFDAPVFVTCIDRLGLPAPTDQQHDDTPRFEVCYQLRSHALKHRVRLKVRLPDGDLACPSLAGVWPAFDWQERETFDMYGVEFQGHPDLRRIYMYEEFQGYPLRKDYPKEKRQPLVRRDDLVGGS